LLVNRKTGIALSLALTACLHGQTFGGGLPAYDGPSILGRGGTTTGMRGADSVPITLNMSITGSYDSNILGYAVNSDGTLQPSSAYGGSANIAVGGRKLWRRSVLGLDYSANYNYFSGNTVFNGTNQQLSLGYATQIGSRWQIVSQTGAGTSNRIVGGPTVFQTAEYEFLNVPIDELFDTRAYFIGNTTGAIYNFTRRSSVRFSGSGSTVRRKAPGLVDLKTYGASADWVHRLSRRTSFGVSYSFSHYDFSKVFGESDIHTVAWHVSRTVGRDWTFSASLTGSKQSTVGIRTFQLDPVLSAILGRNEGQEVFESNNLLYGYSGGFSRRIRRSTFSGSAGRAIIPGNGLFLTSINESAGISFSHNLSRELAVQAGLSYGKMKSLGFTAGAFEGWTGGAGITYKLAEGLGLTGRYDWRRFDLERTNFNRNAYRVSIGISYFPQGGIARVF